MDIYEALKVATADIPHMKGLFYQLEGIANQLQEIKGQPRRGILSTQVTALLILQTLQIQKIERDIRKLEDRVYGALS